MQAWSDAAGAQFDAAITTLENALGAASDATWTAPCGGMPFWRAAYHALFFLDLYAHGALDGFAPPAPFDSSELEEDGAPTRTFTRDELLAYARHGRARCHAQLAALDESGAARPSGIPWLARRGLSAAEAVLYNLRHVQHHAAQLNLVLRQVQGHAAPWISRKDA